MPEEEEAEAPRMRPVCHAAAEGGGPAAHTRRARYELQLIGRGSSYGQRELSFDENRSQPLNPTFPLSLLPFAPGIRVSDGAEIPSQFGWPPQGRRGPAWRRPRAGQIDKRYLVDLPPPGFLTVLLGLPRCFGLDHQLGARAGQALGTALECWLGCMPHVL